MKAKQGIRKHTSLTKCKTQQLESTISILQNQQALSPKLTELEVTIKGNGVLLPLRKLVFICR